MPAGHLNQATPQSIVKLLFRFALLLACFFAGTTLRAQSPCLVGRGPGANGWTREDASPIGRQLREAAMARNGPTTKLQELYATVLAEAEQLPDTDLCKARALFYVALFYRRTGDSQKAVALQQRVIAIDEAALPPADPRFVLDLRELGNLESARDPAGAEATYQRVLSLMQDEPGMTSADRVFTCMSIADFYEGQNKFPEAEALYRQALDAASNLQPSLAEWSLQVRSKLAHVLQEEGNTNQADAVLAEPPAGPIPAPRVPGSSPVRPDLSAPLTDMARANQFASEGNLQDAEAANQRAVSALEKINDPAAKGNLIAALSRLGDLYRQDRRFPDAETTLLQAFDLWETTASQSGSRAAEFVPTLGPLMSLYKDEGQRSNALPFLQRTLALQDRMLPPNDFAVFFTLNDLTRLYREQGNYEPTIPLYRRELAIGEKNWGADSPLLAGVLDPYATALEKLNRPDEAAALRARINTLHSSPPAH